MNQFDNNLEQLAYTPVSRMTALLAQIAATSPWKNYALGIDVSGYVNQPLPLQEWHDKYNVEWLMAKMGDSNQIVSGDVYDPRNYVDPLFSKFCQLAYDVVNKHGGLGIPFGGYFYWRGRPQEMQSKTRDGDPQYQAFKASFKKAQIGKSIHWVTLDLEDHSETNSNTSEKAKTWYHWMTSDPDLNPIYRMVYTSMGFLNTYSPNSIVWLGGANEDVPLHMAQWPWSAGKVMSWDKLEYPDAVKSVKIPGVAKKWQIWQWAGDVSGLHKNGMDLNFFNGTWQDMYTWLNFTPRNAVPIPDPDPEELPVDTELSTRVSAVELAVKDLQNWRTWKA